MNNKFNTFEYQDYFIPDIILEVTDMPPSPHHHQIGAKFSNTLINYIKSVENGIKKGYNNGKWYVYTDPAGIHIGYGHKIKDKSEDL